MHTRIKRTIIAVIVIMSCYVTESLADAVLKNVYHHRGIPQHYGTDPELATVVFYFSAQPTITLVNTQAVSPTMIQKTYRLSGAQIPQEHCNTFPLIGKQYRIALHTKNNEPYLVVTYDKLTVALVFNTFNSISLQKGLSIHFFNRAVMHTKKSVHKKSTQKTVIVDCGHGGTDSGAIGCNGIKEKDITLAIGLRLAHALKKRGIRVLLMRSSDTTVPLDERTSFANTHNADLFVSIHANYAKNSAQGIDTFALDTTLLHTITALNDDGAYKPLYEHLKTRVDAGNRLAHNVHAAIMTHVHTQYPLVVDRKVKHEIAQILLGSHMPAVLIEVGFVSHPEEAKRLVDATYQQLIADSICNGILLDI
jgi:N-acetylmuramoyl-L-alanine amidase